MILLHEGLVKEATHLKELIVEVFAISVLLLDDNLDRFFMRLKNVEGYFCQPLLDPLAEQFPGKAVFLLTVKDLYETGALLEFVNSPNDDWIFGKNFDRISVVSVARLMGKDNSPRRLLDINYNLYLRRMSLMTIHEIGHGLIHAPHHKEAFWVNTKSGIKLSLGEHCDDNTCAMYEVIDVHSPPVDEGYLMIGDKFLPDGGIDEHLNRVRRDWLCPRCRNHIVIPESYMI